MNTYIGTIEEKLYVILSVTRFVRVYWVDSKLFLFICGASLYTTDSFYEIFFYFYDLPLSENYNETLGIYNCFHVHLSLKIEKYFVKWVFVI